LSLSQCWKRSVWRNRPIDSPEGIGWDNWLRDLSEKAGGAICLQCLVVEKTGERQRQYPNERTKWENLVKELPEQLCWQSYRRSRKSCRLLLPAPPSRRAA
jgi:hypothetical protein